MGGDSFVEMLIADLAFRCKDNEQNSHGSGARRYKARDIAILSLDMCFVMCICASCEILAHFEVFEIVKFQVKIVKKF